MTVRLLGQRRASQVDPSRVDGRAGRFLSHYCPHRSRGCRYFPRAGSTTTRPLHGLLRGKPSPIGSRRREFPWWPPKRRAAKPTADQQRWLSYDQRRKDYRGVSLARQRISDALLRTTTYATVARAHLNFQDVLKISSCFV